MSTKAEMDHKSRVAALGCCICSRAGYEDSPAEVHHVRRNGWGRATDFETIPLCPLHHRHGNAAIHAIGVKSWERLHGISQDELLADVLAALGVTLGNDDVPAVDEPQPEVAEAAKAEAMSEEWRAIPGFEGIYEASSEGRIRSLDRTGGQKDREVTIKGRLMIYRKAPGLREDGRSDSAVTVTLHRNGRRETRSVACWVLMAWIGRPLTKEERAVRRNGDINDHRACNVFVGTRRDVEAIKAANRSRKLNGEGNA